MHQVKKIAVIGECMLELSPSDAQTYCRRFAGDSLNTAVYLQRLGRSWGVQVDYFTALGTDVLSQEMIDWWKTEGIGTDSVRRLVGFLPGLYMIQTDAQGERQFFYWRQHSAAKVCFSDEEGARLLSRLETYSDIYVTGVSLAILTPNGRENLLKQLQKMHQQGARIYFDYNYRPILWGASLEKALEIAKPYYQQMNLLSEMLFLSEEEYRINALTQDGVARANEVILKAGAGVCTVFTKQQKWQSQAEKVEKVIDTTAAGDAFAAAYLLARWLGKDVLVALRCAHRLAAAVVAHPGAVIDARYMPTIFFG